MKYFYDKHFDSEGRVYSFNKVDKVITVRLNDIDIGILQRNYPGKTLSYAIRSAIHTLP